MNYMDTSSDIVQHLCNAICQIAPHQAYVQFLRHRPTPLELLHRLAHFVTPIAKSRYTNSFTSPHNAAYAPAAADRGANSATGARRSAMRSMSLA